MKYLAKVDMLKQEFQSFGIEHIPREKNERADLLAKLASTKKPGYNQSVIQETVHRPTVEVEEVFCLQEGENWFTPITSYLESGLSPDEEDQRQRIIKDSTRYVIVTG